MTLSIRDVTNLQHIHSDLGEYRQHILTPRSLTLIYSKKVVQLQNDNPLFDDLRDAVINNRYDILQDGKLVSFAQKVTKHTKGKFNIVDGVVVHNGDILPAALSAALIKFVESKIDTKPLEEFWKNLKQNPSEDSRQDLYGFLEKNNVPLTPDGCFVAYKRITDDYKDIYTKTVDNSLGRVVKMDRDEVNPDRNQTCSFGLHVAAFEYASGQYSNGLLVEVIVNPKNVVAVPTDYNQQKMRVCEYKVNRICGGKREELVYVDPNEDFEDEYNELDDDLEGEEDDFNATDVELLHDLYDEYGYPEDQNDDGSRVEKRVDSRGSLLIPSSSLAGCLDGCPTVDVFYDTDGYLVVIPSDANRDDVEQSAVYSAGEGNVRITAKILGLLGKQRKSYTIEDHGGYVSIS
jgi:hypothetical protein